MSCVDKTAKWKWQTTKHFPKWHFKWHNCSQMDNRKYQKYFHMSAWHLVVLGLQQPNMGLCGAWTPTDPQGSAWSTRTTKSRLGNYDSPFKVMLNGKIKVLTFRKPKVYWMSKYNVWSTQEAWAAHVHRRPLALHCGTHIKRIDQPHCPLCPMQL